MKDAQKKALLLHTAGRGVPEVFKTLQPTDDTSEAAIKALTTNFALQVNKYLERYQFAAQVCQKENESLDAFVTRLMNLGVSCEFLELENVIIDQVIAHCTSQELRKKLLQDKDLTLEKVLIIGKALETSNRQSNIIDSSTSNRMENTKISTIGYKWKNNENQRRNMPKPSHRKVPNTNGHKYQNQAYTQKQQEKPKCYRCGKTDHLAYKAQKFPATGQTCQNCRKMGPFATVCRFPKQYVKKINATVDTIGQENNAENVHDNQDNSETDFSFRTNSVNKNAKKHIMVEVIINGKPILMQVDTAADVSIMSEKTL
ncbi:uncharacterized protein [Palaemon carinicauda]|uniref:uncharacterized protein n=1 Tax=Palaemon carinicauda TaxID=392227 RepID=UPI0035B5E91E